MKHREEKTRTKQGQNEFRSRRPRGNRKNSLCIDWRKLKKSVMKPDRIVDVEAKSRVVGILRTVYNYCLYGSTGNSHLPQYGNCLDCV